MRLTHLGLGALALVAATLPSVAQEAIEWSGAKWLLRGNTRVEDHLGRSALRLASGSAALTGEPFENGTIEFDVAGSGVRSFVGVAFRRSAAGYEHVYVRPHQSGRFDAVQYTPEFNGLSAWQLYPEFNAATELPPETWIHVRMEIQGSQLLVWVGDTTKPVLEIERMRRGPGAGAVVLTSFVPGATAESPRPNAFSNVKVVRSSRPVKWKQPSGPPPGSGFVRNWSVSNVVPGPEFAIEELPADFAGMTWQTLPVDELGRANLAELAGRPQGEGRGMVFARARVRAARDMVKRLNFGASDQVSVFLDGQLLFTGNNTYRSRSLRYLGVMTVDNDALYLRLSKGDHELVFAVIESFGGWGVTARFADEDGLTLIPVR